MGRRRTADSAPPPHSPAVVRGSLSRVWGHSTSDVLVLTRADAGRRAGRRRAAHLCTTLRQRSRRVTYRSRPAHRCRSDVHRRYGGSTGCRGCHRHRGCRGGDVAGLVERGLVAPDWAEALAPVARRSRRWATSCEPRCRRPRLPAAGASAARVQPADGGGAGADRRPGPVPDARPPDRPVLLGRPATSARCRAAWATSTASCAPTSASRARARRPDAVVRPGRAAAEPGAHGAPGTPGSPPRQGLGGGHRAAIRALVARGGAARRRAVGQGRADLQPLLGGARGSSPCTRARCRPTAGSSGRGRSAG